MKKMKNTNKAKKIICTLTALTIALCSAGCGAVKKTDEKKAPENRTEVQGTPETNTAEKSEGATDGASIDKKDIFYDEAPSEEYAEMDGAFAADGMAKSDIAPPDGFGEEPAQTEVNASAGTLTGGEWNDNENWGFFTNLINSGTIEFPSFGLDPRQRTAVSVKNSAGEPIVNARVRLIGSDGAELWSAVTDKSGTAYLFIMNGGDGAHISVSSGGKEQDFEIGSVKKTDEQGNTEMESSTDMEVIFEGGGELYEKTEIMFIVDSTGSMSDEMLFLQSEFSAIAEEIGTENTKYSVNFYRDEGDEYVTKCSGFSDDISEIQRSLNSETADGGGDEPEAVAEILKETITEGEWSEDSVKIAFLIFDAPPHSGTEETLAEAAKAAAKKGVRLVPVVSSNGSRDTELFARALAICTGGTYVFLTDDSGVGDSHLEPIIGDYKVEKLYDIIVRIIGDYKQ